MAVQNLVLVSDNNEPLSGIVDVLMGENPEMAVFRTESLDEFLDVTRHLKAEVLVADINIHEARWTEMDDLLFTPTRGNAREDIAYLKDYIRRHYSEDLSLARLSEMTSITTNYLCSIFKAQEGESIGNYVTRVRMEKAALFLIIYPDVCVKDIALRVGYRNGSYFDRVFLDYYGLRPRDYRRRYTAERDACLEEAED